MRGAGQQPSCWGKQMAAGLGGEGLLSRTNQTVTDGAAGTAAGQAGELHDVDSGVPIGLA